MKIKDSKVFLPGQRISLRPLAINDVSLRYHRWLNDPEVNQYNAHAIFPYSIEELKEYVKQASSDRSKIVLAIVDNKSGKHIGNLSLQNIDWVARSAEFAIIIGDRNFWEKGVGLEAGKLIVDYAFTRLNLNRIYCGTSSQNMGMQKLAGKLGMKPEGCRRQAMFKDGKFVDIIEYGILNIEYEKQKA
ncbi:GNAT family N-acetyltransferase [Candidatus Collierbacteria bacterium]|nr:GNAT family N-acetyltransferase [Candidatus Collierbacteria bacterium]